LPERGKTLKILEEVEEIAEAVENEAENLQQEMGRESLSGLVSSLLNQKSKLLQNYRQNSKTPSKSRTVELKFISQISGLQSDTQQQQELALHNLEISELEFAAQLSELKWLLNNKREQSLEKLRLSFQKLTEMDAQQQQELVLENLKKSQLEFTSSLNCRQMLNNNRTLS